MNFTLISSVLSILIISVLLINVNVPIVEVDYISVEKVVAIDYIAVLNALVHAQRGGSFKYFLSREIEANFTVEELIVDTSFKKAVVVVDHRWTRVKIAVFLRLRVLGEYEKQDIAGNKVKYILVEVCSDRPVQLCGGKLISCNGTRYVVELAEGDIIRDNRGLEVRV